MRLNFICNTLLFLKNNLKQCEYLWWYTQVLILVSVVFNFLKGMPGVLLKKVGNVSSIWSSYYVLGTVPGT